MRTYARSGLKLFVAFATIHILQFKSEWPASNFELGESQPFKQSFTYPELKRPTPTEKPTEDHILHSPETLQLRQLWTTLEANEGLGFRDRV